MITAMIKTAAAISSYCIGIDKLSDGIVVVGIVVDTVIIVTFAAPDPTNIAIVEMPGALNVSVHEFELIE